MSQTPANELPDLLSHHLLGTPYNPDSTQRENFRIQHLTTIVRDWEVGEASFDEVLREFDREPIGTFDARHWFAQQEANGDYVLPDTTTH